MRVLMIDDEPDIRKIGKLSLEGVGRWPTELAASGPEGIARAQALKPDLILMDMMMPGMDGLTTLDQLRTLPEVANIPVIFMTAKIQRNEIEEYIRRGAVGVIQKPFDPMALCNEINAILGK